jgi:hypothetical protein
MLEVFVIVIIIPILTWLISPFARLSVVDPHNIVGTLDSTSRRPIVKSFLASTAVILAPVLENAELHNYALISLMFGLSLIMTPALVTPQKPREGSPEELLGPIARIFLKIQQGLLNSILLKIICFGISILSAWFLGGYWIILLNVISGILFQGAIGTVFLRHSRGTLRPESVRCIFRATLGFVIWGAAVGAIVDFYIPGVDAMNWYDYKGVTAGLLIGMLLSHF